MVTAFIRSFQSEWLKKKRSLASWLVLVGAFFTPSIILLVRLKNYQALPKINTAEDFWQKLWYAHWESMAILLLPFGIMLATGLIAQIEYKNNTWKQLHTTPQSLTIIFFAKLSVILVMLIEVFALFNLGYYLVGVIPSLIFSSVPYPTAPFPFQFILESNLRFFVDCLPILALQYLLSIHYKNFLVPLGVGFIIWVLGIGTLSWQYNYIFPYIYCGLDHLLLSGQRTNQSYPVAIQTLALGYFAVFMIASYVLYLTETEKG